MISKIRVLDETTINKIAAGEVIENPASVIKELVENSLDAGATEISVDIRGGGRQLIRVTDNGCGMSSDDALLCLERHATSKIRAVEDIHELITMGFRGEAVPSIASISKFSLLTRQRDTATEEGTMVLVEGGKILKCCPAACSAGTTIEVKSLFFNVPVRKKFQKSPAHDVNEILKTMTLLALGYPHIKFRLTNDQEVILTAPLPQGATFHEKLQERAGAVLGGEFISDCLPLEAACEEFQIRGWIGLPSCHRQNRTGQFLFINQRGVQSPPVSFAVKEGYGTTIPAQRHPIFLLHINMSGSLVDVNVHPQKREVRLRHDNILREMLSGAVREAIQKSGASFFEQTSTFAEAPIEAIYTSVKTPPPAYIRPAFNPQPVANVPPLPPLPIPEAAPPKPAPAAEFSFNIPPPKKTAPRVLATIPSYLILESLPEGAPARNAGLCLVDQRAAHARIIYEKLSNHHHNRPLEVQNLLIPHTIELAPADALCLKRHLPALEKRGIHLKEFGKNAFLLDGLPEAMGNIDPSLFIQELVAHLKESDNDHAVVEHMDRKIAQTAVRASVSKDRRLSISEGQALVQQLIECDTPWYCPQGKPTLISISPEEISKQFS